MKTWFLSIALLYPILSLAEFSPHEVMPAAKGKQDIYVMDAIIRGGDPLASSSTLANVRWAKKPDYERIVFDIEGTGTEWQSRTPPYFQVGLNPQKGKISLDIRNVGERRIQQSDLKRAVSRSAFLKDAYLAPKLQGELASLDFTTKTAVDVEAFYLVNPPRIILDIRAKK